MTAVDPPESTRPDDSDTAAPESSRSAGKTARLKAEQARLMDRIADGKIVEHWANADLASIMRQLGVFPPPRP